MALGVAAELSQDINPSDPLVTELSNLLRGVAVDVASRHRNPHGVACKVRRLRALLDGKNVQCGGAVLEKIIHAEYVNRPAALAAAVAAARASFDAPSKSLPSRGPVPTFGDIVACRKDGATLVYIARLAGAVLHDGRQLAKIGRSADVARRMEDLNEGLPVPLGLRWRAIATWQYPDAAGAHAAEQAMLARCGGAGWSVGGEFIAVDAGDLTSIVTAGPCVTGRRGQRQSLNARDPRGLRRSGRRGRARLRGRDRP